MANRNNSDSESGLAYNPHDLRVWPPLEDPNADPGVGWHVNDVNSRTGAFAMRLEKVSRPRARAPRFSSAGPLVPVGFAGGCWLVAAGCAAPRREFPPFSRRVRTAPLVACQPRALCLDVDGCLCSDLERALSLARDDVGRHWDSIRYAAASASARRARPV